jgi:hypothetical protein
LACQPSPPREARKNRAIRGNLRFMNHLQGNNYKLKRLGFMTFY